MNRDKIHALTDDALRRAIAERLGWRLERRKLDLAGEEYYCVFPNGAAFHLRTNTAYAERAFWECVPDWPRDEGAALAACMDVARARGDYLLIEPNSNDTWGASMGPLSMEGVRTSFEVLRSPLARALAELLLLALDGDA